MKRKLYTGLVILLVLFIGATLFMLIRTTNTEPNIIYNDVEPTMQKPTAQPRHNIVKHGDHSHEIPINSNNDANVQNHIHNDSTPTDTAIPISNNPVQDLRAYLEKQGHWSAKWIPEFPPEDKEAARMAHNCLIMLNHTSAGNIYYDGAALIPAREVRQIHEHYKYVESPRAYDIYKLGWSLIDKPVETPESFNVYGFDKAAFDKTRAERLKAREENNQ